MGNSSSCHTLSTITRRRMISLINSMICAVLLITTFLANSLIIIVFKRKRKLLYNSLFYRLLLNMTIADLLTALISDADSVTFLLKEYFGERVSKAETKLLNFNIFLFNSVSLLTMTILCVERVVLLVKPVLFKQGLKEWQSIGLLLSIWVVSGFSAIPYLFMDYIRYLMVFLMVSVGVSFASLLILAGTYKKYLTLSRISSVSSMKPDKSTKIVNDDRSKKNGDRIKRNIRTTFIKAKDFRIISKRSLPCIKIQNGRIYNDTDKWKNITTRQQLIDQRRVKNTFSSMMLVYLATYLPLTFMTGYMNLCCQCNCTLIDIMRDWTCIALLASALLRPLNFIFRLRVIKKEVQTMLNLTTTENCRPQRRRVNTELSNISNTGISYIVTESNI